MTKYIRRIPVFGSLARRGYGLVRDLATLRQMERICQPCGKQVAHALRHRFHPVGASERGRIRAIERERQRMLRCEDPLVDGTLGEGGLYDQDQSIQAVCRASKSPRSALLLYRLVREFKPLTIVELGTNVGISSAYMAAAQACNGQGGQIVTLEASPYRIRLARALHRTLGLANVHYVQGLFSDTLDPTLRAMPPVDCAFIDGHHQCQPTLDYFGLLWEHARPVALFLFDDIWWSEGMQRAWVALQADLRLRMVIDLGPMGIALSAHEEMQARVVLPPFSSLRL